MPALIHSEMSEALKTDKKYRYCELDNENWMIHGVTLREYLQCDDIRLLSVFEMSIKTLSRMSLHIPKRAEEHCIGCLKYLMHNLMVEHFNQVGDENHLYSRQGSGLFYLCAIHLLMQPIRGRLLLSNTIGRNYNISKTLIVKTMV